MGDAGIHARRRSLSRSAIRGSRGLGLPRRLRCKPRRVDGMLLRDLRALRIRELAPALLHALARGALQQREVASSRATTERHGCGSGQGPNKVRYHPESVNTAWWCLFPALRAPIPARKDITQGIRQHSNQDEWHHKTRTQCRAASAKGIHGRSPYHRRGYRAAMPPKTSKLSSGTCAHAATRRSSTLG